MTDRQDESNLQQLREKIERLWAAYLDPQNSERRRRAIGAEIDQVFNQIRITDAFMDVFLATEPWAD